jgi:acetyl esterase/lipase
MLGSARAFTCFAGQIAARVGVEAFIPDYRLAPEHKFQPRSTMSSALIAALAAEGADRIVIAGDSQAAA